MNRFLTVIASLMLMTNAAPAHAGEREERAAIVEQAAQAMQNRDFASLERQYRSYTQPMQRTASGASKVQLFDDGVARAMRGGDDDGEDKREAWVDVTRGWVAAHAKSPLAYLLQGQALMMHGLYFRGSGYVNSVAPQAMQLFHKHAMEAAELLAANVDVASEDTGWNVLLLSIGRWLAWPRDVMFRVFDDGLVKNPADFRLYYGMENYFLPKWEGSPEALDEYINAIARRDPQGQGMELYARLYSGAADGQFGHALYSRSRVDWARMQQGLQDWTTRYPTPWNRNIYAYHACIAGDKPTTARLLKELGSQVDFALWEPNGRATYESCRKWLESPDAEPAAKTTPAKRGESV
jgi:hypothetical protein